MKQKIKQGTKATLNGIGVEFVKDTELEFAANSLDQLAELASIGGLEIELTEDGQVVRYGASGKRLPPAEAPKPEPKKAVKAESPKAEKGTKAAPKKTAAKKK